MREQTLALEERMPHGVRGWNAPWREEGQMMNAHEGRVNWTGRPGEADPGMREGCSLRVSGPWEIWDEALRVRQDPSPSEDVGISRRASPGSWKGTALPLQSWMERTLPSYLRALQAAPLPLPPPLPPADEHVPGALASASALALALNP